MWEEGEKGILAESTDVGLRYAQSTIRLLLAEGYRTEVGDGLTLFTEMPRAKVFSEVRT